MAEAKLTKTRSCRVNIDDQDAARKEIEGIVDMPPGAVNICWTDCLNCQRPWTPYAKTCGFCGAGIDGKFDYER